MYTDLFRLALNNLFRARGRLLITSSGVFIGTTAVILLVALTLGLQESAEAGLGDNESLTEIIVYPNYQAIQSSEDVAQITFETLDFIRALDNVQSVIAVLPLQQQGELHIERYVSTVRIFGIAPQALSYLPLEAENGDINTLEVGEIIVGKNVLSTFSDSRSGEFVMSIDIDIFADELTLIISDFSGIEEQRIEVSPRAVIISDDFTYNSAVFLPISKVIALNNWLIGEEQALEDILFDEALVQTTGREATLALVEQIEALGYATESLGDFLGDINNFFNIMRVILGGIGVVALVIASFGIANTMMMAILERTSEIGLMKAIGARDADVLMLFLFEAGLVGLIGGLVGAATSLLLRDRINNWIASEAQNTQLSILIDSAELQNELLIIPNELLFFAVILATFIGLAAGAFPAYRAARILPVLALKEE